MSVPEGERGEGKFRVHIKARELCTYTIKICTNQNVFLPQYQNALTNDIIQTAKDIYIDCWTANNIMVKKKEDWNERKRLQEKAARSCNNLLAMMQIAQSLFHLKIKRVKYWGEMTTDVRSLIRSWKESDTKRYSEFE